MITRFNKDAKTRLEPLWFVTALRRLEIVYTEYQETREEAFEQGGRSDKEEAYSI